MCGKKKPLKPGLCRGTGIRRIEVTASDWRAGGESTPCCDSRPAPPSETGRRGSPALGSGWGQAPRVDPGVFNGSEHMVLHIMKMVCYMRNLGISAQFRLQKFLPRFLRSALSFTPSDCHWFAIGTAIGVAIAIGWGRGGGGQGPGGGPAAVPSGAPAAAGSQSWQSSGGAG